MRCFWIWNAIFSIRRTGSFRAWWSKHFLMCFWRRKKHWMRTATNWPTRQSIWSAGWCVICRSYSKAGVCRRLDAFFIWADAKIVLKRCFWKCWADFRWMYWSSIRIAVLRLYWKISCSIRWILRRRCIYSVFRRKIPKSGWGRLPIMRSGNWILWCIRIVDCTATSSIRGRISSISRRCTRRSGFYGTKKWNTGRISVRRKALSISRSFLQKFPA